MSLGSRLARGAVLMVVLRWVSRALGLASAMVLARLLSPADFGLVAVALAVAALLEMVFDASAETSLISRRSRDPGDWNTAWSIRVSSGLLIAAFLVIGGVVASHLYGDERYYLIFTMVGIASAIQGSENIGVIAFRLDLDFERDAGYLLACRVVSVVLTVACAWLLRSYLAILVAGILAKAFQVAWSYRVQAFRPRWSLGRWRTFLGFSVWMLVLNIGKYALLAFDRLLLAGFVTPQVLGYYKVAADVSELPVSEVVLPVARTLGVGFASVRHDSGQLGDMLRASLGLVALLIFPVSIGLMLVAEQFVAVLLGAQWGPAVPYVRMFAFFFMMQSLMHYCGTALIALERVRPYALVTTLHAGGFLALSFALSRSHEMTWAFSIGRAAVAVSLTAAVWWLVRRERLIGARDFIAVAWRPLASALAMAGVLTWLDGGVESPLVELALKGGVGAMVYTATLLALWTASGRPLSPERTVLKRLLPRLVA
ncbi:MAG: oligosaccharide flippase family protein [Burkholderiaceae bacterium]